MKLLVTRPMTAATEAALRDRFDVTILDRTQGLTPDEAAQAMRVRRRWATASAPRRFRASCAAS